ncbi:MAG: hypothetical protein R3B06_25445 [Kofleriaceae bacterium]
MRARGVRAAVAALALAWVGCGNPDSFTLRISWSEGPEQACGVTTCADLPLACDAWVRLRIVDAVDDTQVFYSDCFALPAGADLCALRDLAIPEGVRIPDTMVRIQLAVWSAAELALADLPAGQVCPATAHFDGLGFPQRNADVQPKLPVPALGREIYFPVGQRTVAALELGCSDPAQLDARECRGESFVDATLTVPRIWSAVANQVGLEVEYGEPIEQAGQLFLGNRIMLAPTQILDVTHWQSTLPEPVTGLRCLRARVLGAALPYLTCDVPTGAAEVTARGYAGDETRVRTIGRLVDPFAIEDAARSFVVGYVIDGDNRPVAGAVVTPSGGNVFYPNDAVTALSTVATAGDGMFTSADAPIDTVWSAVAPGLVDDGTAIGGVMPFNVTMVVVRMRPAS